MEDPLRPVVEIGGEPLLRASSIWHRYREALVFRRLSPATIRDYRWTWHDWCAWLAPRDPLRATPKQLQRYLDRPTKGRGNVKGPRLSDASRATISGRLCTIYRWLAAEGITSADRMARFPRLRRPKATPRFLSDAAVTALFSSIDGDARLELMIWLAFGAGLRRGEIARLRIEDVRLGAHPSMTVHGKGARDRVIPINQRLLVEVLSVALAGRPRTGPVITSRIHGRQSYPIGPAQVGTLISRAMHAAGLDDSAHALRHTFAHILVREGKGTNIRAVAHLLGDTLAVTEQVYTAGYRQDAVDTVELLPDPRPRSRRRARPAAWEARAGTAPVAMNGAERRPQDTRTSSTTADSL